MNPRFMLAACHRVPGITLLFLMYRYPHINSLGLKLYSVVLEKAVNLAIEKPRKQEK